MESTPLQVTYRAIFTQMLLAQSAAIGAFADVATRCALLARQQYQHEFLRAARKIPSKGGIAEPTHPGGRPEVSEVSLLTCANSARAYAAMPRISMMVFLSQYDKLRERRGVVQDRPASER
jgi:hypothetical protein